MKTYLLLILTAAAAITAAPIPNAHAGELDLDKRQGNSNGVGNANGVGNCNGSDNCNGVGEGTGQGVCNGSGIAGGNCNGFCQYFPNSAFCRGRA